MTFKKICESFNDIESISSRNAMTQIVADTFKLLKDDEIAIFSYLLTGRIAPMFVDAEFNMSEKSILKALNSLNNFNNLDIVLVALRSEKGDIGLVAEDFKIKYSNFLTSSNKTKELNVEKDITVVYRSLWDIVKMQGSGSTPRKAEIFMNLFNNLSPLECKYLSRIIVGKLRLGVSDMTILDAISVAIKGDKSIKDRLEEYYGVIPDIGLVAYRYISGMVDPNKEESPKPVIGVPVRSRLVERIPQFEDLFDRFEGKFYLQPKFDGLRCQVHKGNSQYTKEIADSVWVQHIDATENNELMLFADSKNEEISQNVKLFSRNLENLTEMFPEIVDAVKAINSESFILDCELVGWDDKRSKFSPFQETMKRKRKYDIDQTSQDVPVRLYVFDILCFGEESLINTRFSQRLDILRSIGISDTSEFIKITETREVSNMKEVKSFFKEAVKLGLEGLIAKDTDGVYEPGKRSYGWIKLKKSMSKKLVDTLDVVVMGYYKGSGRQSSFGIGALLVGVINDNGDIESISKIGTGITDEKWSQILTALDEIAVSKMPNIYKVDRSLEPDVWVQPDIVATVEADEITKSKIHKAGRSDLDFGLALRFPRLIEFGRDKNYEDATSVKELLKIAKL